MPCTRVRAPALLLCLALLAGCGPTLRSAGIRLLYREAPAPRRVLRDVPYRSGSVHPKHRLDLFLPASSGWPALVFVHGGGWDKGDKDLVVAGADVYGNIGRFYADHGIGTAVINYRLQPEATWRQQVEDVAHAVAWMRTHARRYGGDPRALFLAGHSAGAQLAVFTALEPAARAAAGLTPGALCGVIPVSGAAYDLTDERTYELGASRDYLEQRFRLGESDREWMSRASATTHVSPAAPPFLLLYGALEWRSLAHQNRLLDQALRQAGVASELHVYRQLHQSMVLALAREGQAPARAVLDFIHGTSCGAPRIRRSSRDRRLRPVGVGAGSEGPGAHDP